MSMRCDTSRASWLSSPHTGLLTWLPVALRRTLACKESGRDRTTCSRTGQAQCRLLRERPWVTLLTGTWRARAGLLAASPVI
jgi:hypothetical protein